MWCSKPFRRASACVLAFWVTSVVAPHSMRAAQPAPLADAAWEPWLGCWELVDDRGRAAPTSGASDTDEGGRPRICVVPEGAAAVSVYTYIGERRVLAQRIATDGQPHPVDERECRGEQRAEWSRDGSRIFTRAKVSCGNDGPRSVSSLTLMASGPTWIDIQHVEAGGRGHLRVRRYRRADDQRVPGVPPPSGAPDSAAHRARAALPTAQLSVAAVAEAARLLPSEVIEAALVETGLGFVVNARSLVALDDAGVPDRVIDLAVALAYPSKFHVDRPDPGQFGALMSGLGSSLGAGSALGLAPWGLAASDPYFLPYYASPIGYGYWGSIDPVYLPSAGYVAIGDGGTANAPRSGNGRVVNGLGYTQVRARSAEETAGDGRPAGSTGGQTSSGGTVSAQGYSGGGDAGASSGSGGGASSGGDSGRTAQPR